MREVMQEAGKEAAPSGFTDHVMGSIEAMETQASSWNPIITRRAWLRIAAIFVAFVGLVLWQVGGEPGSTTALATAGHAVEAVFTFFSGLRIPTYVVASVMAVFALVLFERYARRLAYQDRD